MSRRHRLRPAGRKTPLNPFNYRNRRSETPANTGRQVQREAILQATQKAGSYWLQRFGLLILLLAAMASAVNILSLSTNAKVLPLSTTQNKSLRPLNEYEAAASQLLAGSIWNRNKITVDTGNVSRKLLEQFPELTSVSLTIPLLAHRPLVYIQPAEPALILVNGGGAYIIDTSGKALLKAPTAAELGQPQLPLLTDQSGLSLQINRPALTAGNVSFIQTVTAQLAAKQLSIASMTLPIGTSELDIQLAGQAYIIKFNLQSNDARQQAGTLLATLAQLQKQNITPAKYIDVRVSGRAYYQ